MKTTVRHETTFRTCKLKVKHTDIETTYNTVPL